MKVGNAAGKRPKRYILCFCAGLAFNALLGVLCCLFLAPHFRTNDDMIIHLITSGAYGEASEFTGFVNVIASKFLMLLQRSFPAVNHFAVLQVGALLLALSVFESLLLHRYRIHYAGIMSALLSFLVLFRISELHYTATAFVLTALGLGALLLALRSGQKQVFAAAAGGIFALLGSMLRFNAFLMAAAFILIPFLLAVLPKKDRLTKVLAFVLVFVLAFAANFYNSVAYSSNELTENWLEFCSDRQQISDYALPSYSARYLEYMQLGITETEFQLLDSWLYADRELFPEHMVAEIAKIGSDTTLGQKLWFSLNDLKLHLPDPLTYCLLAAVLALGLLCSKRGVGLLALQLLLLASGIGFCLVLGRITAWVLYGAMLAFFVGAVLLTGECPAEPARLRMLLSGLVAGAVLVVCFISCGGSTMAEYKSDSFSSIFFEAQTKYEGDLLLCTDIGIVSQRMATLFEGVEADKFSNIYVLGGWEDGLPSKTHPIREKGITSPYRALAERADVLLMDKDYLGPVMSLVQENFGYSYGFSLIDSLGGYRIFAVHEDMGHKEPTKTGVLEAAIAPSYHGEDMLSLCFSSNQPLEAGQTAYIRLAESGAAGMTYRCKTSDAGSTLYEAVIPKGDVSAFGEYTAQLIILSGDTLCGAYEPVPVRR